VNSLARILALAVATVALAVPAVAHHSFSMFDMQKEIVLTGEVKDFQWTNPHIWVQVLVKDAAGKTVEWSIEGNSPSTLSRQGWSKRSLKAGDTVTVTVHPLRDGQPGGSLMKIVLADGTVVGDTD
jgi:Family of unknown function (DUF6152)